MADNSAVSLSDSQFSSDSGVQTNDNVESQLTESKIMKDVEYQSTPIQNKKNDGTYEMLKAIQAMIENQSVKLDEHKNEMQDFKSSINKKLDIQNSKFDIQKNSFEELLKNQNKELKHEIQEMNKNLESTHEIIRNSLNKLEQKFEKLGDNVLSKTKGKNDEIVDNFESIVGVKNNDENIKNESTDELVEGSDYEMLMCVSELERERKNNVVVEWGQRANFPFIIYDVYDDLLSPQVLWLKGKSPVLVDELRCLFLWSNCVPSVRNNCESVMWCYEEREVNREWYVTELYNLNRKYDEWKEGLEIYLNNNDYNDLIKIIRPIVTECNDGDVTKILNVDWFNEYSGKMSEFDCSGYDTQSNHLFVNKKQQCYIKPRLIWDDGG